MKDKDSDEETSSGGVKVSVDGASSRNGTPEARAGYGVWWHHPRHRHLNRSERVSGDRQTNEVAEIQAATRAIQVNNYDVISQKSQITNVKLPLKLKETFLDRY